MFSFRRLHNEKDTESKDKGHPSQGFCKVLSSAFESKTKMVICLAIIILLIANVLVILKIHLQRKYNSIPMNPPPLRKTCPPPPEDPSLAFTIEELLDGPVSPTDQRIITHVRTTHLQPPSTKPYNLKADKDSSLETAVYKVISQITENKKNGIFVEVGALDGEHESATLGLEKLMGWSGLLLEPDSDLVFELKQKNRKAWIAPGCATPFNYPRLMKFYRDEKYVSSLNNFSKKKMECKPYKPDVPAEMVCEEFWSQCYPLVTLFTALDYKEIDFLSLNLHGEECKVISTVPLDKFKVKILQINTPEGEEKLACDDYLQKFGMLEVQQTGNLNLDEMLPGKSMYFSRDM